MLSGSLILVHVDRRLRGGRSQKRPYLQKDDDQTDAGHEARHHRIREVLHVLPDPEKSEQDLQNAAGEEAEQHDSEPGLDASGFLDGVDDDGGAHDGHRSRRTRGLRLRSTERGREDPDRDRAVETGSGSEPRLHAEREGQRQRDDSSDETAGEITFEMSSVVGHRDPFSLDKT